MALTGCGAAEDGIDQVAEQAGLSGDWSGTWKNEAGTEGLASFHIEQKGLSVMGTVTFHDNPCLRVATISGRISGTSVAADLDFGNTHLEYEASLFGGTEMKGIYESVLQGGPCESHQGVLSLVR